ncbi:MAG TPA: cyclic nucleotide-binding domain-containing protein, partial [Anaerolineae bacterium]|nr:cyclic nucleotide-binding domain-containing protein [Anaerolineae bacterium]
MQQDKLDFLSQLPIFASLTRPQLLAVAQICQPFEFKRGNIIAHKGDHVDQLHIVRSGRLEAFDVDENEIATYLKHYEAGDYFEDIWLCAANTHPTTIRAATNGVLYLLQSDDFFDFLEDYPRATLDLSEEAWDELDRGRIVDGASTSRHLALLPGEVIEYETRRTPLLLIFELAVPLLLAVVIPTILVIILRAGIGAGRLWVQIIAALLGSVPLLLFSVYRYLDWANDYLWITTKHLVRREFDLRTFSVQMEKIPINRVQSIRSVKPTILETFLGLGTVHVTTASHEKGLTFDKISNPSEVETVYNKVRSREKMLDAG